MSAIPLVRVSAFLPFVKFLDQVGAPTEKLLNQARLSTTILDDPQALMPLYQSFAFGEKARHSEGIELLGALVSQRTQISDLDAFGSLILQSLTLQDLLNTVVSKLALHNSGAQIWTTEEEDRVWLHHKFINPAKIENQQAQYFVCLLILKAIQLAAGKQWHPDELHFQASELKGFRELNIFFNTRVRFNQSDNAFCIPKSLLSRRLKRSGVDPSLQLQEIPSCTNFKESSQQLLRSLLQDGYPSIELIAEAAGMSVRSFQRRLSEEKLSYSRIVEEVRFDIAIGLLDDPTIPIIEIAYELGYTEITSFSRAFRRWTGVSPREFRNQQLLK